MNEALLRSRNMAWRTPQKLFDELDEEFGFVLDAASSHENAKCARYFTKEEDGLAQSWVGGAVFCNPPYGKEIPLWVEKAYREHERHGITVVLLIPARPDTSYWHDYILHGKAAEIRFLRGRLRFEDEDGKPAKDKAPFPSAVVIYRRTNGRHERDAAVYGDRNAGRQGETEVQRSWRYGAHLHPKEDGGVRKAGAGGLLR